MFDELGFHWCGCICAIITLEVFPSSMKNHRFIYLSVRCCHGIDSERNETNNKQIEKTMKNQSQNAWTTS